MLVRFRQDVVALQPKAVVILAGTNDIAGNTGPVRIEDIEANFASLRGVGEGPWNRSGVFLRAPGAQLHTGVAGFLRAAPAREDRRTESLAEGVLRRHGCVYLDYFSALVDKNGLLRKELADDGLHPNHAGYKIMAPMAERAIREALGGAK